LKLAEGPLLESKQNLNSVCDESQVLLISNETIFNSATLYKSQPFKNPN